MCVVCVRESNRESDEDDKNTTSKREKQGDSLERITPSPRRGIPQANEQASKQKTNSPPHQAALVLDFLLLRGACVPDERGGTGLEQRVKVRQVVHEDAPAHRRRQGGSSVCMSSPMI